MIVDCERIVNWQSTINRLLPKQASSQIASERAVKGHLFLSRVKSHPACKWQKARVSQIRHTYTLSTSKQAPVVSGSGPHVEYGAVKIFWIG